VKFLEAHQLVSRSTGGSSLPFLLAMSGTPDPLELYVRAHAAKLGHAAEIRTLAFNTLQQTLIEQPREGEREVFLLTPWDLVPALDWRTGIPPETPDIAMARDFADEVIRRVRARERARLVYLDAPVPPAFGRPERAEEICATLTALVLSAGGRVLPRDAFQLSSYLSSGCPVGGNSLSSVGLRIAQAAIGAEPARMKVLITDLDNVMWSGVIGEDGVAGIACGPDGRGFKHFLYQSLLSKLQRSGVLLAAVSRNDPDLAAAPFVARRTAIGQDAFVCIVASYSAKSSQIRRIAEQLNLGLDSMVFVDDNPVELEEVSSQLPSVTCVPFPDNDDALPSLLNRLASLFASDVLTAEDRERTEMYRRRLAGMVPSDAAGADLSGFLRQLEMKLTIHDRGQGDRTRAVQLINKTNQFNLNGRRVSDDEVSSVLAQGGKLFTASLSDRHGEHGEILSYLANADGVVESFVLSCRVFQRRVEHAFVCWLVDAGLAPSVLRFAETARNEPIQQFLRGEGFAKSDTGDVGLDAAAFQHANGEALGLFAVSAPELGRDRVVEAQCTNQ